MAVEARGLDGPMTVTLWRLADEVARAVVTPDDPVAFFGALDPGGYGVEADDGATTGNVNDFPTEATAAAPQDATYIEPWAPHDELRDLARLARKAAGSAPRRPVVLASYLPPYARPDDGAGNALRLVLATAMSHGATCLLFGEEDAVLVDPYYVRHAHLDAAGREIAKAYLDFAVRYGDLLFDAESVDVSRTYSGGINEEIVVSADVPVSADGSPGTVWARVTRTGTRRVVSLVDLCGQDDTRWDSPKRQPTECGGISIAFERSRPGRYFFASPEGAVRAIELAPRRERWHDVVDVPPFVAWATVWAEG